MVRFVKKAVYAIYLVLTETVEYCRLSPNLTAHSLHFTPFVKQATLRASGYRNCSLQRSETS
ncbi:hypothetical protein JOQ06_023151, partial [Pogonophryne albipinna]